MDVWAPTAAGGGINDLVGGADAAGGALARAGLSGPELGWAFAVRRAHALAGLGVQGLASGAGDVRRAATLAGVGIEDLWTGAIIAGGAAALAVHGVPSLGRCARFDFGTRVANLLEIVDTLARLGVVAFGAEAGGVVVAPAGTVPFLGIFAVGAGNEGFADQSRFGER